MREIHKVPASAGAEWLLAGFTLLRRAPVALGSLGVIWALVVSAAMALAIVVPVLGTAVQFLLMLAGPLFMGGLLWAVREVDQGRPARPAHLLQGLHDGRAPHLLVALLPQVLAGLLLSVLLLAMIGSDGLVQLQHVMVQLNALNASGKPADPAEIEALVATLPAGRILLWLLVLVAAAVAVALALFVMPPQVMFDRSGGWKALRNSLRASLHNLPAMLVFLVLAFIALFAIYFVVMIVVLLVSLVAGQAAAMLVAQLLLMGVLMPVFGGAVYAAWKQMFEPPADAGGHDVPPPPRNVIAA